MIFSSGQAVYSALLCSLLFLVSCGGGADSITWTKTFGRAGTDHPGEIKPTRDGCYIFTGATNCNGGHHCDVYLAKLDISGAILWERTYGGSANDWGLSVQETADGGYILLGTTASFGNDSGNIYLIKTDANGELLWQKTYGGVRQQDGGMVRQTADEGYIIVGSTNSFDADEGNWGVYLIKTDGIGTVEWERTYGGPGYNTGQAVQQTLDGGYIVAGRKASFRAGVENAGTEADVYLIKTDEKGNALWEKTYGGRGYSAADSVQQTSDGGYFITGVTEAFGATKDIRQYLIKTDITGNVLWQRAYLGSGDAYDISNAGGREGRFFAARSAVVDGDRRLLLMSLDEDGNLLWERTYGVTRTDGYFVQKTSDGGYIVSGITNVDATAWFIGGNGSDFFIVKTDSFGNTQ